MKGASMLVESILIGIDNDAPVASCIIYPSPVKDLVLAYNQFSIQNPDLPGFSPTWTGREFKNALKKLEARALVGILHNYSIATKDLNSPIMYSENPRLIEDRINRTLFLRITLGLVIFLFVMLLFFIISVATKSGTFTDTETKSFVSVAIEILKYIISPTK